MKSFISEAVLSLVLIVLAASLWNPFWMPMGALYVVLACFIVALGGFVAFIWRARGGDEREVLIRQTASRIGYTCAASVLALGMVWQTLVVHAVDPWLAAAFILAVVGKAVGYAYGRGRY